MDDLNKHRSELDEQNLLHKELVRTIFTQKNVEQPLIVIVQKLGEKIQQYDDKILKKIKILKQNGIPIDLKQSSSSSSSSSDSEIGSRSPSLPPPPPPPPSKDKSSWSNYFTDPKSNRNEIENVVPSNRGSNFTMHRRSKARATIDNNRRMSGTTASKSNHKSNHQKNHDDKFSMQKKCIAIDLKVDEIDMSAYETTTLEDLNKLRSQLDEQNHLYKELVQTIFTQKNVEKPLIAIVQQLDDLASNYPDEHDQLIVPFIKIAEIIRISRPQLHIMEWARDKIFAGLYGDIVNYRDLPQQIDQCQDEVIKSTLIESFEMKKSESLKCYRGTLNIIGTMYNKSISRPNKDIHEIFRYLSKQSTKQNCEIYLELLTDFILLVGPKFLSSSSNDNDDKNSLTITQMDEILMKFKHSSSSSSNIEWPDYLESKRTMAINLIENQMKSMNRRQ
ncbi:hypothetical protein DERP_011120 [Dermatophagoides pteronyssinus]|uniref:Uncharacterized protein n=1 Tax=Dermatophagoides pteronyssinus TaxID=6956 RepID=A0ABQ8J9A9_DERPT|nr:hypothetical protein DERP_011120 [Dermatophagoides pteronyssinus]